MRFFKSFFSGKHETPEDEQKKTEQKNFEILKYDGMRAQRMGRADYAVQCYTRALELQTDIETMSYLAKIYIQTNKLDEARTLLGQMIEAEPTFISGYLTLANVCFMQEDYAAMAEAARQAIDIEKENATAHFLLARATRGQGDELMTIAHLTQAIVLKEDYTEARLLRAEVLQKMLQWDEARKDIDTVLAADPDDESALLLQGRLHEATGHTEEAEAVYKRIIELNPFNEQAFVALGKLYTAQGKPEEAIALLDEAVELNPNCPEAYHERGRAKLMSGDKEGATADMKHALQLNPREMERLSGAFDNQPRQTNILGL